MQLGSAFFIIKELGSDGFCGHPRLPSGWTLASSIICYSSSILAMSHSAQGSTDR